jgi:hypothetical protein
VGVDENELDKFCREVCSKCPVKDTAHCTIDVAVNCIHGLGDKISFAKLQGNDK